MYDVFLIDEDVVQKLSDVFKEYEDKIIFLENKSIDLSQGAGGIDETILDLKNKISHKESYIKKIISQELGYLGYSPKYNGTKYMCEMIYVAYKNNEESGYNLKKNIYPVVAEKYGKTVQNIKCNIINATDIMVCECEEKRLIEYLGFYNYVKPGPKKIIEAVVKKLKEKIQ